MMRSRGEREGMPSYKRVKKDEYLLQLERMHVFWSRELMHMCRDRRTMWLQYGTGCTSTVQKVIAAPSLKHDKMNLSAAEKSSTQNISPRLCSVLFSSTQFSFILFYSLLFCSHLKMMRRMRRMQQLPWRCDPQLSIYGPWPSSDGIQPSVSCSLCLLTTPPCIL